LTDSLRGWSRKLPGYLYVPDDDLDRFPTLDVMPSGLVIHSGSVGKALGEYTTDEPDGRCVAYHFAWFEGLQAFCQTCPLDVRAFHAGKAGNMWWGIGLPGPYSEDPRRSVVRDRTIQLCQDLMIEFSPTLRYWCRHSDISPKTRKDPGPGVKESWFAGVGLIHGLP
jgi:hypothetical protein